MTKESSTKESSTNGSEFLDDRNSAPPPSAEDAKEQTADQGSQECEKRVNEVRAEADKYRDQLLRKAAEFENYKRRVDIEWQNFQRSASERVLMAMLPVADDFARSLKSGAEKKNFDAFYEGVELIYAKFMKILKAQGIEPIEAVGKPFSVDEHDALLQVPRTDVPHHTVLEEVEKGYKLNDRVLRHAKVVVSTATGTNGTNDVKA